MTVWIFGLFGFPCQMSRKPVEARCEVVDRRLLYAVWSEDRDGDPIVRLFDPVTGASVSGYYHSVEECGDSLRRKLAKHPPGRFEWLQAMWAKQYGSLYDLPIAEVAP